MSQWMQLPMRSMPFWEVRRPTKLRTQALSSSKRPSFSCSLALHLLFPDLSEVYK